MLSPLSPFSFYKININNKILLLAMMKNEWNIDDLDFQNIIRETTSRQYLRLYSFAPSLKSLFSTPWHRVDDSYDNSEEIFIYLVRPGIESTFPMTTQQ